MARSEAGADGAAPLPILACPPPLGETEWSEDWAGAPAKSAVLAVRFAAVADELGLPLIDLGQATRYSALDGIHLDANGHAASPNWSNCGSNGCSLSAQRQSRGGLADG